MEATSSVAIFKIGARFVGEQMNYDEFISLWSFGRPHGGDLNSLEINLIASVPEKFVLRIRARAIVIQVPSPCKLLLEN